MAQTCWLKLASAVYEPKIISDLLQIESKIDVHVIFTDTVNLDGWLEVHRAPKEAWLKDLESLAAKTTAKKEKAAAAAAADGTSSPTLVELIFLSLQKPIKRTPGDVILINIHELGVLASSQCFYSDLKSPRCQ